MTSLAIVGASVSSLWDEESWGIDSGYRSSLYQIDAGFYSQGVISSSFDHDYYQVDLLAGVQYTFFLTSDSALYGWSSFNNSSSLEFDLTTSSGGLLASSSIFGLYDDVLVFSPTVSGQYYIDVHGLAFSPADYAIGYSQTLPGLTNTPAVWSETATVYGTPTVGHTIAFNATFSDPDQNSDGVFYLSWYLDGVLQETRPFGPLPITGVPGQDLSVSFSYFDDLGFFEQSPQYYVGELQPHLNRAPTGTVSITGTAQEGATLAVSETLADADGLGAFSYQWLRDGAEIAGATGASYSLTQADLGAAITVTVSYTDGFGTMESVTSAPTAAVGYGDTLVRAVTTTLPRLEHVVNLTLTGSANISGYGNAHDNTILGNSGNNLLRGRGGDDRLEGGAGNDRLYGDGGDDVLIGGSGNDRYWVDSAGDRVLETVEGSDAGGTDLVYGTVSIDLDAYAGIRTVEKLTLLGSGDIDGFGNALANTILGNRGDNWLVGGAGNDNLKGGGGADTLEGGLGRDLMSAGNDDLRDVFVFRDIDETRVGAQRDRLYQFDRGEDVIDLRALDADASSGGVQGFSFAAGPAAHAVWAVVRGNNMLVQGDVDGDGVRDFEIMVMGVSGLDADDFLL